VPDTHEQLDGVVVRAVARLDVVQADVHEVRPPARPEHHLSVLEHVVDQPALAAVLAEQDADRLAALAQHRERAVGVDHGQPQYGIVARRGEVRTDVAGRVVLAVE